MHLRRLLVTAATSAVLAAPFLLGAPADAASGPPLSPSPAQLAASLTCHGDPAHSTGTPVLLVPGTTQTPAIEFSWGYEKAFTEAGRAWCAVTLPNYAMSDAQVSAEYVVNGIRTLHQRAGTKISVVGHSQGGMLPRWALKYWPDTRGMVDDLVGLAPSNHGTYDAYPVCALGGCAPSIWQQQTGSRFLAALNKGGETYAGISYTQVYTVTDEVVTPNLPGASSSSLSTGAGRIRNVAVQSVCPTEVADHLSLGTSDPVGYALAIDALDHDGTADPAHVNASVCTQLTFPAIDKAQFPANFANVTATALTQVATYPHVPAEPALKPYAR